MARKNNRAKELRRVAHYTQDEEQRLKENKDRNERRKQNAVARANGVAPRGLEERREWAKKPKVAPVVANKAII